MLRSRDLAARHPHTHAPSLMEVDMTDTLQNTLTDVIAFVPKLIVAIIIVGAGGGLIKPMRARWATYRSTAEAEVPRLKEEAEAVLSVRQGAG